MQLGSPGHSTRKLSSFTKLVHVPLKQQPDSLLREATVSLWTDNPRTSVQTGVLFDQEAALRRAVFNDLDDVRNSVTHRGSDSLATASRHEVGEQGSKRPPCPPLRPTAPCQYTIVYTSLNYCTSSSSLLHTRKISFTRDLKWAGRRLLLWRQRVVCSVRQH